MLAPRLTAQTTCVMRLLQVRQNASQLGYRALTSHTAFQMRRSVLLASPNTEEKQMLHCMPQHKQGCSQLVRRASRQSSLRTEPTAERLFRRSLYPLLPCRLLRLRFNLPCLRLCCRHSQTRARNPGSARCLQRDERPRRCVPLACSPVLL